MGKMIWNPKYNVISCRVSDEELKQIKEKCAEYGYDSVATLLRASLVSSSVIDEEQQP